MGIEMEVWLLILRGDDYSYHSVEAFTSQEKANSAFEKLDKWWRENAIVTHGVVK